MMLLAIFVAYVYRAPIFSPRTIPAILDTPAEFQPILVFGGTNLINGVLPLWNPYPSCGYPLFALGCGVLYFTTPLYGFLSFPVAVKVDFLIHVFIFGIAAYALCRHIMKQRVSAVFVSLFLMAGTLTVDFWNTGYVLPMRILAYVPFVLLGTWRLLEGGRCAWILLIALSLAAQIYGGNAEFVLYEMVGVGFFAFANVIRVCATRAPGGKAMAEGLLRLSAAILIGLALALPQLLPSWELLARESVRAQGIEGSPVPMRPIPLTLEGLFEALKWKRLNVEGIALAGPGAWPVLTPLAMAGACFAVLGRRRWPSWTYLAVFVCLFVLALGPRTPLYSLYSRLPLLGQIRTPCRMAYLMAIVITVMAGLGYDRILSVTSTRELRATDWLALFVAVSVFLALPMLEGTLTLGAGVLILGAFVATGVYFVVPRRMGWLCFLLWVVCFGTDFAVARNASLAVQSHGAHDVDSGFRDFSQHHGSLDRMVFWEPGVRPVNQFPPNMGVLTRNRMASGYIALPINRYVTFFTEVLHRDLDDVNRGVNLFLTDWLRCDNVQVLDILNIKHILVRNAVLQYPEEDILARGGRFRRFSSGSFTIYENLKALPPAYVVHEAQTCADMRATARILTSPSFNPSEEAVLSSDFDMNRLAHRSGPESVVVTKYDINSVELAVSLSAPGLVILTDTYYPGWKAVCDGEEEVEVLCANGLFRAVFVPEGQHTVRFAFLPASFVLGLVVAGIAFAVLVSLGLFVLVQHPEGHAGDCQRDGGREGRVDDCGHGA